MTQMILKNADILATKHWEGVFNRAYQDSGGVWTIGAGHTGPEVHEGLVWSDDQINYALIKDMFKTEEIVNSLIATVPDVTYNEFRALCDFEFNTGALAKSTLLKYFKKGDLQNTALEFLKWDHVKGQVIKGLLTRREAEKQLFLQPDTKETV